MRARLMLPATLLLAAAGDALRTSLSISDLRELQGRQIHKNDVSQQRVSARSLTELFPEHYLDVPVDHFHNDTEYEPHSNDTFKLRYWFDASSYNPGGPVFLLSAGELDGEDRLPFLEKGIIHKLAQVTGGLAVILEHRYYGKSWPVDDLSTQNLRFCTTDQALADTAYFAQNIVYPGLEYTDVSAKRTPYIAYGGSYAGVFVAILRKLYPRVFWGAISSSGVTAAVVDYWQYYEAARLYGPKTCVNATQKLTHIVDTILLEQRNHAAPLREVFSLQNITHDNDFARVLSNGISGLQDTNWDPDVSSPAFSHYCGNVSSEAVLYPWTRNLKPSVRDLIKAGGYDEDDSLTNHFLNYIGYVYHTAVEPCHARGQTQDECFSNHNSTFYAQDNISQTWRSWPYQYCKQWGYFQTGSGVPAGQLPMVSRLLDLEYNTIICREAFNITTPPDVESINKHGGFNFSYPRVALLDGAADPWRAATPHAIGLPGRKHTVNEPFWLIDGAVHHWDENGRFENETTPDLPPRPVAEAQEAELAWVLEWLSHLGEGYLVTQGDDGQVDQDFLEL